MRPSSAPFSAVASLSCGILESIYSAITVGFLAGVRTGMGPEICPDHLDTAKNNSIVIFITSKMIQPSCKFCLLGKVECRHRFEHLLELLPVHGGKVVNSANVCDSKQGG